MGFRTLGPKWIGTGQLAGVPFIAIECTTCSGTFGVQEGFNGHDQPSVEASHCPGCGENLQSRDNLGVTAPWPPGRSGDVEEVADRA